MKAIGVFSARVRVEEKQIIAATGEAGGLAVPVLPASTPLPPGPASPAGTMLGDLRNGSTDGITRIPVDVLIDRAPNRAVAAVSLQIARLNGVRTIDAGIAATGTRISVATALELAGLPRPASLVGFSEESSVEAAMQLGHPVTLFGLQPGSSSTALHDADTAEAVIEHRVVLGDDSEAIVLLQAGMPAATERTTVHVVGGSAVATSGVRVDGAGLILAERAAAAIGASLVAIELAQTAAGPVVWDVLPVADFRQAEPVGETTVAAAIAALAMRLLDGVEAGGSPLVADSHIAMAREGAYGFALSA